MTDTSEYTVEQRVVVSTWAHERPHTNETMTAVRQRFVDRFGIPAPPKITILRWEKKLFTLGSVTDKPRSGRKVTRQDTCASVADSILQSPMKSIRKRSLELGVPRSTMMRHMKKDLGLHTFQAQLVNELCDQDKVDPKDTDYPCDVEGF